MRAILTTPTPDPALSAGFYRTLGFRQVVEDPPVFAEDTTLIEVDTDRFARPGVKLYARDWSPVVRELDGDFRLHETRHGWLVADPSNVWIRLQHGSCPYPTVEDAHAATPSALGSFAGLSLESGDIQQSVALWEALGFEREGGAGGSWISCRNGEGLTVTLMRPLTCPHLFFNPSLTYFNGARNLEIIEGLRRLGVHFAEEITHFNDRGIVDNVILQDPGGWGIFVFND